MAQVSLREYCQEVEGMIERSAYDEAVAHCRHILQQYPKYVETYRLLGKTALDREEDKQASELFARVLSADPADFVSRAGLAIIYDRQNSLNQAAWQMERAYELEPGNPVVQEELRKLYARRDGVEPDRIPLTRGALARLYLNGELYSEAAAELRALLVQEPDRVDLQILLAEALWRDEQRLEAADMALQVLDRLPYCLDANLILGEIWMSSGREEDAEVHLKRAQALDPEAMRANMLFGNLSPISAQSIQVTRLAYEKPVSEPVEQVPEWLAGIGAPVEPGAGEGQVPAWLQGLGAGAPEAPAAIEPGPAVEAGALPIAAPVEPAPAWLSGIGAGVLPPEAPVEELPAVTTEGETMPDWLSQLGVVTPEAEQEVAPDWLSQLSQVSPTPAQEEMAAPESAEIPDWLQALKPSEEEQLAPPVEEAEGEGVPDWLAQLRTEIGQVPVTPGEPSPEGAWAALEAAEIPDWLQALKPEGVEQPGQAAGEGADWLAQLRAEAGQVPSWEELGQEPMPSGLEAAEMPEWLAGAPAEAVEAEPAQAAPTAPEAEVPAWMTGEGAMPSPEEALAYFQKLTAGREAELSAQAQAEAEARMAEITGRKPEAAPAPQVEQAAPAPEELGKEMLFQAEALEQPVQLAGKMLAEQAPVVEATPAEKAEPFVAPTLPSAEVVPQAAMRVPSTPGTVGPEWWYQTMADEEGPTEEERAAEAAVEEAPVAEQVAPVVERPPEPTPAFPKVVAVVIPATAPLPAAPKAPARKKLVRAKPAPAVPPQPAVDIEALVARLRANPDDHEALLNVARGWVRLSDLNAARTAYDELVRSGELMDDVISDLETIIEDHPDDVESIRLLGDAHMKSGHLQRALRLYRQALKKL